MASLSASFPDMPACRFAPACSTNLGWCWLSALSIIWDESQEVLALVDILGTARIATIWIREKHRNLCMLTGSQEIPHLPALPIDFFLAGWEIAPCMWDILVVLTICCNSFDRSDESHFFHTGRCCNPPCLGTRNTVWGSKSILLPSFNSGFPQPVPRKDGDELVPLEAPLSTVCHW